MTATGSTVPTGRYLFLIRTPNSRRMDWLLGLLGTAVVTLFAWGFKDRLAWQSRIDHLEDQLRANGDGTLRDKVARLDAEISRVRHDVNNVKQVLMNQDILKTGDDWRFRR